MPGRVVWIEGAGGTPLCADLYLPAGEGPFAPLLEALPYRKDDVTASYRESYERLVGAGFAVCRLDLRGTGSSGGVATDEYPDVERADLRAVIAWLAGQPWSTGRVGMFGTSYSGFNSLHMAAEGVPELGAVVAAYATDDRFTDDVHYCGGVLRAVDLIDYVLYMVAMNALPPVPALWGDGWRDEWRRRIDETPPWLFGWLGEQVDGPAWRRGSIRLGPGGAGYARISCPTMLVAGWADGYRNNTFRTVEHLTVPWRLLAGPWSHRDPALSRPGPNIDADAEIIAFFDEHLRGGAPSARAPGQVFVRRPTPARARSRGARRSVARPPGLAAVRARVAGAGAGRWRRRHPRRRRRRRRGGVDLLRRGAAVGPAVGPARRRRPVADVRLADRRRRGGAGRGARQPTRGAAGPVVGAGRPRGGQAVRRLPGRHVGPDHPRDAEPDPPRLLARRGRRHARPRARAVGAGGMGRRRDRVRGDDVDARRGPRPAPRRRRDRLAELLAAADAGDAGARPRGGDPVGAGGRGPPESTHRFGAGAGPSPDDADGVVWRIEHDVLGRETRVVTRYGGSYPGAHGAQVTDEYAGTVGVSTVDPGAAWARGRAAFTITWPVTGQGDVTCATAATLEVRSDAEHYHVEVGLTATVGDEPFGERAWSASIPRFLQ